MRATKLILVDGVPGSGKSTTTQTIARQLEWNGVPHQWLHEETSNHPLHSKYEERGSIRSTDVDDFIDTSLQLWRELVEMIMSQDKVYVIESFLYQSTVRILYMANVAPEKVSRYVNDLYSILRPTQPAVVYLYKDNLKRSFENVFAARGERWKQMFIRYMQDYVFFQENSLEGEIGTIRMWDEYQNFTNALFDDCQFAKISLETSGDNWEAVDQQIAEFLEVQHQISSAVSTIDPMLVCGVYSIDDGATKSVIKVKLANGELYCEAFWPFIRLLPVNFNTFQLRSFPIEFSFVQNVEGNVTHIAVKGNHDWSIMDKNLVKVARE